MKVQLFILALFGLLSFPLQGLAQTGVVSQVSCRDIGGQWQMRLPNCRCPHDSNLVLDPRARNFQQSKKRCNDLAAAQSLIRRTIRPAPTPATAKPSNVTTAPPTTLTPKRTYTCPTYLEKFLTSDYQSYSRPFKKVESPAQACVKVGERLGSFTTSTRLENLLANEGFTSVGKTTVLAQGCLPSVSDTKKSFYVAEYYYLMNRIKHAVAKHLDEVALIDSVLGSDRILSGVNCSYPEFQKVQSACRKLQGTGGCGQARSFIPELAKSTTAVEDALKPIRKEINELEVRRANDNANYLPFTGERRLKALQAEEDRMKEALPWMMSPTYKSTLYQTKNVASAITAQLRDNRSELMKRMTALRSAISCLNAEGAGHRSACENFEDTMAKYTDEIEMPPMEDLSPRMINVANAFKRVECHRGQREEVQSARRNYRQFLAFGLLTTVSFGSGSIASAIISQVPRLAGSTAARAAILTTATAIPEVAWVAMDIKAVRKECSNIAGLRATNFPINHGPACSQVLRYGHAVKEFTSCATSAALAIGGAVLGGTAIRGVLNSPVPATAISNGPSPTPTGAARPRAAIEAVAMTNRQIEQANSSLRGYMLHHYQALLNTGRRLERALRGAKTQVVYDVVVVGAGPHSSIAIAAIREIDPNLRILVIEATENLGVFHKIKGFLINTSEFFRRSGNSFSASPVQLRDFNFSNQRFTTAENLGHQTQATYQYADADMVFNNAVVKWRKEPSPGAWPAPYRVETNTGLVVYNHAGIVGTGFGPPIHRLTDEKSIQIYDKYMALAKDVDFTIDPFFAPSIQTVDQLLTIAHEDLRLGRQSMARYAGKKVMVIGGGDGGNIGVEGLTGITQQLNPNGMNTGIETIWLNQKNPTGDDFRNSLSDRLRPRYEDIAQAFDDGRVTPVDGRIARIEEVTNAQGETKFKVFYTNQEGQMVTEPLVVDHLVFATGYVNDSSTISPIFSGMAPGTPESISFRHVTGSVDEYTPYQEFRGQQVISSRLLVNGAQENVFMVGQVANTPISDAQWEIPVGGFIDILGPRSAATGSMIAHNLAPQRLSRTEVIRRLTPASGETIPVWKLRTRPLAKSEVTNLVVAGIDTKIELGKILKLFRGKPGSEVRILFSENESLQTIVNVTGVGRDSAQELVTLLSQTESFMSSLASHFKLGRQQLEVSFKFRSTGTVQQESLQLVGR